MVRAFSVVRFHATWQMWRDAYIKRAVLLPSPQKALAQLGLKLVLRNRNQQPRRTSFASPLAFELLLPLECVKSWVSTFKRRRFWAEIEHEMHRNAVQALCTAKRHSRTFESLETDRVQLQRSISRAPSRALSLIIHCILAREWRTLAGIYGFLPI